MQSTKKRSHKKLFGVAGAVIALGVIGAAASTNDGVTEHVKATEQSTVEQTTTEQAEPAAETTVEPTPEYTPEPTPEQTYEPTFTTAEENFLTTLDIGDIYYSSEQAAVDLGHNVCDYLYAGGDLLTAATTISENGYSSYDGGFIAGAAYSTICPDAL